MRVLSHLLCLIVLTMIACGDRDVRLASELESFRILGIRSIPSSIDLNAPPSRLDVELIHYEGEAESEVTFEWTLCTSLGAVSRFECLAGAPTLNGATTESAWELPLDLAALADSEGVFSGLNLDDWRPPLCPDHDLISCDESAACPAGSLCWESSCWSLTEIYPLELVLIVKPVSSTAVVLPAAVPIPIHAGIARNQPIRVDGIRVNDETVLQSEDDACGRLGIEQSQTTLALEVNIDIDSIESFEAASQNQCVVQNESAIGLVSWFVSQGELEKPLSNLDSPTNALTLDEVSDAPIRLYAVIRDGRGALDFICLDITRN